MAFPSSSIPTRTPGAAGRAATARPCGPSRRPASSPERLFASGAAHLNQELGASYPRMSWISNYDRLACATMWTLFFAGDDFAPGIGPLGFGPEADGERPRCRTSSRATTSRRWRRSPAARSLPPRRRLRQPQRAERGLHRPAETSSARLDDFARRRRRRPWEAHARGLGLSGRRRGIRHPGPRAQAGRVAAPRSRGRERLEGRRRLHVAARRSLGLRRRSGQPVLKRPGHFARPARRHRRFYPRFPRALHAALRPRGLRRWGRAALRPLRRGRAQRARGRPGARPIPRGRSSTRPTGTTT